MRKKQAERLFRKFVLPEMPQGWIAKDNLLLWTPVKHVCRAVRITSSNYSKEGFDVSLVALALYVPIDGLWYGIGDRLDSPLEYWDLGDFDEDQVGAALLEVCKNVALPFLRKVDTPSKFARTAIPMPGSDNENIMRQIAGGLIFEGSYAEADKWLARAVEIFELPREQMFRTESDFEELRRIKDLRKRLAKDPRSAIPKLMEYERFTVEKCGHSQYYEPTEHDEG